MTNNIENARIVLNAYYKEKKIESKRDKKLDKFLKEGNWKRYQKRCKRIFSDYDRIIQKVADDYLKNVGAKISNYEKMSATALSICDRSIGLAEDRSGACNTSIKAVEEFISDSNLKIKAAKSTIKSIAKIGVDIELKRPQGDGPFTNLAKAAGKVVSLQKKAEKSQALIQANIAKAKENKKSLNSNKKEINELSKQCKGLQKNIKTGQHKMAPFKEGLKKIETAEKDAILNSGLLEKLNKSLLTKELKTLNNQAEQLSERLDNINTQFVASDFKTENKAELNKINDLLPLAKEQWSLIAAKHTTGFRDSSPYYAYYDGIKIYASPFKAIRGQASGDILDVNMKKGYTFIDKKGDFREIKDIGWCRYDDFYTQKQKNRFDYLNSYQLWLANEYGKMSLLKGQKKLDRIKGILSQAEAVIDHFNKKTSLSIHSLDTQPIFSAQSKNISCPHELIAPLRKWIELTEKPILNIVKETGDNENAGSLYSGIDWNTRLKVPQYRTQSDNLISPESTCAPTTFTMMAERAGWSRADIITAIEKRFTNQGATDIDNTWETKGKAFFKWINKKASKNYQKVRAGNIGASKFKALAKSFKQFGQYEDLTIFYHYLINSASKVSINSNKGFNKKLRQGIENDGNFGKTGSFNYEMLKRKHLLSTSIVRNRIKKHLDKGDVVMFSIYHKGAKSKGTHNYHVQSINHKGFVIDDPFGKNNAKYKRKKGVVFDLFMEEGDAVTRHRKNYVYKNKANFSGKDYSKEQAQQLTKAESRGNTTLLSWKMLDTSDQGLDSAGNNKGIISYIVIWEKIKH